MYPEFVGHPLLKDYPATRTQPLVDYRSEEEAGLPLEKLAPFREDEGMAFERRVFRRGDEPKSQEPS
jgi:NADH-quinone oxidoreductase subunit C